MDYISVTNRQKYETDEQGALIMNEKNLRKLCIDKKLYITPELNDTLYLHYMGFSKIQNLEKYKGVKSLWLEGNGISKIENLDCLPYLVCLYIQENLIETIDPEGLNIRSLRQLNLANNQIQKIGSNAFKNVPFLDSLNLSCNRITSYEDFMDLATGEHCETVLSEREVKKTSYYSDHMKNSTFYLKEEEEEEEENEENEETEPEAKKEHSEEYGNVQNKTEKCGKEDKSIDISYEDEKGNYVETNLKAEVEVEEKVQQVAEDEKEVLPYLSCLTVLDLSRNNISDERIVDVLRKIPSLRVLNLMGNPIIRSMSRYRKTIIDACPNLTYLDDRPVFDEERRAVTAFFAGGPDAELRERQLIFAEKKARDRGNYASMKAFLSGSAREKCIEIADKEYEKFMTKFKETGDLEQIDTGLERKRKCALSKEDLIIWQDNEIELVNQETLEHNISVPIVICPDESIYDNKATTTDESGDENDETNENENGNEEYTQERKENADYELPADLPALEEAEMDNNNNKIDNEKIEQQQQTIANRRSVKIDFAEEEDTSTFTEDNKNKEDGHMTQTESYEQHKETAEEIAKNDQNIVSDDEDFFERID